MWTRKEFEDAAQQIGKDFVASGGAQSINALSMKVAQEGGLNPDGIRTVVRLANVAAFEQAFEKRARDGSDDRMVDFTVGDPEVVISQLYSTMKEAQVQQDAARGYDRTTDYFGDLKYEKPPLEKVAAAPEVVKESPAYSNAEIYLLFKKAEDKMKQELHRAQLRWENNICKAASIMLANNSRVEARTELEKVAVSLCGEDILPELRLMHKITSPRGAEINLCGGEKIAAVIDTPVAVPSKPQQAILKLLKEANKARKDSHIKEAGLEWLEQNKKRVSK
jgi:hypothetical protein